MRLKTFIATGCVLALVCLVPVQSVLAHGTEKHQADQEMSEHMQEMYALKEKISAEYRIMERTPIIPNDESLQRGKDLYQQNCAVCHGNAGDGKGPAAAALETPPASFLDRKHSDIYGPGEKYWIIGNGSGKTGMPGFPQIAPLDRWHLVNYILHLQQGRPAESGGHGQH